VGYTDKDIQKHKYEQKRNVIIEKVQNSMLSPFKLVPAASNTVTESDYPKK